MTVVVMLLQFFPMMLVIVPWKKSFVKITSGNVEKRLKNPKNLKDFRKRPNASNCFRMHPNASQWVRMDPKASKSSRKPQKTCENFEKLRKTSREILQKLFSRRSNKSPAQENVFGLLLKEGKLDKKSPALFRKWQERTFRLPVLYYMSVYILYPIKRFIA